MIEFLNGLEYWHWLAFGAALIALEIFVPSAIFLWPGIAGIVVGVLTLAAPGISGAVKLLVWAVLSLVMAAGWQIHRKNTKSEIPASTINRRGEQYVGRHFTLATAMNNGTGELYVDDTRWKIVADHDIAAGKKVKVVAMEGTSFRVEEFTG
jgi:membrane protein implicated in regulation of membrane protease activity